MSKEVTPLESTIAELADLAKTSGIDIDDSVARVIGLPVIYLVAAAMVAEERKRQRTKGYDTDHDDQHGGDELAVAAAVYLFPKDKNPDVCVAELDTAGLRVLPLIHLMAELAHDRLVLEYEPEAQATELAARIETVKRGVALGMAELERLLRMQQGGAS